MIDIPDSSVGHEAERGRRQRMLYTARDGIPYNRRYVFHPFIRGSIFGWTTNFALSLAGAEYCHSANFTCSILDRTRYAAHCPRAPSCEPYPFAAFYIPYFNPIPGTSYIFNGTICILTTLQRRLKVLFLWIWQDLE